MRRFGLSTGALFPDDVARGVAFARDAQIEVVELSALRLRELPALIDFVRRADLQAFEYVSIHAPTDFVPSQEPNLVEDLLKLATQYHWPMVVHPDCMVDHDLWTALGDRLYMENMDRRKSGGRTLEELETLFARFPDARLCFDIAHAHQVDRTMTEAYRILRRFGDRVCQLHVSEVTTAGKHERISETAVQAFREVAERLPEVPVILESPVTPETAQRELEQAARIFEPLPLRRRGAHL